MEQWKLDPVLCLDQWQRWSKVSDLTEEPACRRLSMVERNVDIRNTDYDNGT